MGPVSKEIRRLLWKLLIEQRQEQLVLLCKQLVFFPSESCAAICGFTFRLVLAFFIEITHSRDTVSC